jgi:DNA gyrase/topoisomerase IV subunit A
MGFIFKCIKQFNLYSDDVNSIYAFVETSLIINHNYPIPEDEEGKKTIAMSEVAANVRSHKTYIRDFSDVEDEDGEWEEILSEQADINNAVNDQLNMIRDNIGTEQEISITYFVPDDKKSGGAYLTHSGIVKKIDEFERKLIMQDETVIPTEQISVIQGEMFKGLYE